MNVYNTCIKEIYRLWFGYEINVFEKTFPSKKFERKIPKYFSKKIHNLKKIERKNSYSEFNIINRIKILFSKIFVLSRFNFIYLEKRTFFEKYF